MVETLQNLQGNLPTWVAAMWSAEVFGSVVQALILFVLGFFIARLARTIVTRTFAKTLSRQQLMLVRRGVSYTILVLFTASAVQELGFNLSVLLGAAGIATVAIGFASQTSVSNLISGLFLVLERAVEVGDVITVDTTTGEVLSVDLLSTKLRTFDNLLVRVPNETLVKTKIINLNRFPLRRVDLQVGVAYKEDLSKVLQVLERVARDNPTCMDEPAPVFISQGFGESSVNYQFSVWGQTAKYLELRNGMQQAIKKAFDEEGIEIPFPHRTLFMGDSQPFAVERVQDKKKQAQKTSQSSR